MDSDFRSEKYCDEMTHAPNRERRKARLARTATHESDNGLHAIDSPSISS